MSATMTATVIREHGGPERLLLETVVRPAAGPGEVVVGVTACAINHLDIFVRRGMPGLTIPLPHTSGGDIAGRVVALGAGVTGIELGASVLVDPAVPGGALGETKAGGLAEYVAAPAANLIPLADDDPALLVAVAALPIAYGTAQRMLFDRAQLQAGETVVIVGASGGVGVACVQLAKQAGANVIAVTSSDAKGERLRKLGADLAVVAADGEFGKLVWEATGKRGADVVVDYSGKATWPQSIRCTRRNGRLVTCGATSGYDAVTDLRYVWVREIDIRGSDGWTRAGLVQLAGAVEMGALVPVIHALYPLSRAREALAELELRRAFGKVVVLPDAVFESLDHQAKR
jgi:alcohol dehydrogenase